MNDLFILAIFLIGFGILLVIFLKSRASMIYENVSINEIPVSLQESIQKSLSDYTIGFSQLTGKGIDEDIKLLGTGTLVVANGVHAILTAHHVLEVLPKHGRLGLILSREPRRDTVDVQGLHYLEIARGKVDSKGPDLAAVILSPSIASTLAATKSFYLLDRHKDTALSNPPGLQFGVWCNNGFIAERTIEEPGRSGYHKIKGFGLYGAFGGPDEPPVFRGDFDYYSMPVTYGFNSDIPMSYEGMSGGGLWQIQLLKDKESGLKAGEVLLSGVVFYQEALVDGRRNITCHGRTSIYETAFEAIKSANL